MFIKLKRLTLVRPVAYLKNVFQDQHHLGPIEKNFFLKWKLLLILGLVFFASNLLLSRSSIFSIDNYNTFVGLTNKIDNYLVLDRKLFGTESFLSQFKSLEPKNDFYTRAEKSALKDLSKVKGASNLNGYYFNSSYAPAAYLSYFKRAFENENDPQVFFERNPIKFHWADWVDTTPAIPFIDTYDHLINAYFNGNPLALQERLTRVCHHKLYDERDTWMDRDLLDVHFGSWNRLQSISVCSAIFKYYYWPTPERILFETDYEYFKLPISEERLNTPLGLTGLTKIFLDKPSVGSKDIRTFANSYNRLKPTEELLETAKKRHILPAKKISLKSTIQQDPKDFKRPNFDELIKTYREIKNPTREEKKYLDFLEYSQRTVQNASKFYFRFPFLKVDEKAELHHYTFPWFKKIISQEERTQRVHHLIRSWFKLAEKHNIISWFNYGNLIGWYFNSMNLPWDNDVDVQVSIKDLDYIGKFLNNSLVIEDPKYGDNAFWLQTDPYYMQQNDAQFIDARYIDIKTGIYVDVSALWEDDREKPKELNLAEGEIGIHCKHYNWFGYNEIFPLHRTLYEGAQAYMVNDPISNLIKLYGDKPLSQRNEMNYNWQPELGLWVRNEVCEKTAVPLNTTRFDEIGDLTLYGACNNTELLQLWDASREAREISFREKEYIRNNKSTHELTEDPLPIYRSFNYEPFR